MESRKQTVLMICLWAMLLCARYLDILLDDSFVPDWFDKFFMVVGPVIIILEVKKLYKEKR